MTDYNEITLEQDPQKRRELEIAALSQQGGGLQGQKELPDYQVLYFELLYAVGKKHQGETRHQTALRYIRQAEESSGSAATSELK